MTAIGRIILYAPGVRKGGGLALLQALAAELRPGRDMLVHDYRISAPQDLVSIEMSNLPMQRLIAEWRIWRRTGPDDLLICFANLPPLLPSRSRVAIYFQNALILESPLPKFRLLRLMFRAGIRRRYAVFCQTQPILERLQQKLGVEASCLPFLPGRIRIPRHVPISRPKGSVFRFFYPSSGAPHKNHGRLLDAWRAAIHDLPAPAELRLTIAVDDPRLRPEDSSLGITALGWINKDDVAIELKRADAMVFPSLEETIGMPLVEAHLNTCPVAASNLPFASNFISPAYTFDPTDISSIEQILKQVVTESLSVRGEVAASDIYALPDAELALREIARISGWKGDFGPRKA